MAIDYNIFPWTFSENLRKFRDNIHGRSTKVLQRYERRLNYRKGKNYLCYMWDNRIKHIEVKEELVRRRAVSL